MSGPAIIEISSKCNTDADAIRANVKANQWWTPVTYGVMRYPVCAVVGAGPSLKHYLPLLKEWQGDIFGINDTAAYLSDNGIPSYLYMIDASDEYVRPGINVKGAVLATRCHPRQFIYRDIRTFDLMEDVKGGISGGPSAPCRASLLFLRMGYRGIAYFGCDSCFYDMTHLSGDRDEARKNSMMIIRCGGKDYLTNAAMLLQANYLSDIIRKNGKFLFNFSHGLLKAAIENENQMNVAAVNEEMMKQKPEHWNKEYPLQKVWADAARI